jgi:hypothetical protein
MFLLFSLGPFSLIISSIFLHVSLLLFYFLFGGPLFQAFAISLFFSLSMFLLCVFVWCFSSLYISCHLLYF